MIKQTSILFVIALLFLLSNNLFAQLTLFGGAAIPAGAFGGTTITNEDDGFAKLGFNLGLQNDYQIANSLNWATTAIVSINSFDEAKFESQLGGLNFNAGSYYTYWLLTGLGYETQAASNIKIYFQGQGGILFAKMPDITLSYNGLSASQTANMATTFAFGFGAGVKINKINASVRYCYGNPEYEETATSGTMSATVKAKLPASLVCIDIGYIF